MPEKKKRLRIKEVKIFKGKILVYLLLSNGWWVEVKWKDLFNIARGFGKLEGESNGAYEGHNRISRLCGFGARGERTWESTKERLGIWF